LQQKLLEFSDVDPASTLTIIENYLVGGILESEQRKWFRPDTNLLEVFKKLHKYDSEKTEELIETLLTHPNGGRMFWSLKDVV